MDKELNKLKQKDLVEILSDLKEYLSNAKGSGLYEGLMGACICYFILSEVTAEQKYTKQAKKLLAKIQQSIPNIDDFGFAEGLAGIGWGVEWLVQNKFIKTNTDLVLEDLDDVLYGSVVYSKDTSPSLADGSIGKALYFLYRMQANNPQNNRYRFVCNLECLILLSDEISEKLTDKNTGITQKNPAQMMDAELREIAQGLILMLRLKDKKINTETTMETIKAILLFLEKYMLLHAQEDPSLPKGPGFLSLILAYQLSAEILEKTTFSSQSISVKEYLAHAGFTSDTIINLISEKSFRNANGSTAQQATIAGSRFLEILQNINSIKNTSYGYEAFMLK
ncbi:lanthionine synthetase LanC family protein [Pedobacter polysacchareus]|uniref:lanthionine synthetase LanC family protein n=1 Tax=Pedobacter polysacchareus TaxID=2861973 RepID=UPI001C993529|nr:lanthionine synthetase LanC family protein [Pedobacter polysacchareus]